MAKPTRNFVPFTPHHVTSRGNNQRVLFSYPHEREMFLYQLARAKLHAPCDVHAVALLTNHFHLVLSPPDELTLPRFMKHLKQCYAQKRNGLRVSTGTLFEGRYDCSVIGDDEYMAVALAYVDLNPVADGESESPEVIQWSTYGLHVPSDACRIPRGLWTPSPWYLALGRDDAERAARYAVWLREYQNRRELNGQLARLDTKAALTDVGRGRRVRRPSGRSAR